MDKLKQSIKSIVNFISGDVTNFIYLMFIVFGFGYAIYITVKFVLESNNLI